MPECIKSLLSTRERTGRELPELSVNTSLKQSKIRGTSHSTKAGIRNKLLQQNSIPIKIHIGSLVPSTNLKIRNSLLGSRQEIEDVPIKRVNLKKSRFLLDSTLKKHIPFHPADHSSGVNKDRLNESTIDSDQLLQQINIELKNLFKSEHNTIPNLRHLKLAPLKPNGPILQGKERQFINLELVSYYSPKIWTQKNNNPLKPIAIQGHCYPNVGDTSNTTYPMEYNITFGPNKFHNAVSSFTE